MTEWIEARPSPRLFGEAEVPGDKSISQRAAIFAALAEGTTALEGYQEGEDAQSTLRALEALGAGVRRGPGGVEVTGVGLRGFRDPEGVLDLGNSGTGVRLLLGALAGQDVFAALTGDASLSRRPMGRVVEPLRRMGARIDGRDGGRLLPLCVRGGGLKGMVHRIPVASAQVKSALLLAGLGAEGVTRVEEPAPSRDHTERMLPHFGVEVRYGPGWAEVEGPVKLRSPGAFRIAKDPSSAAFPIVAAVLAREGDVVCRGVSVNPTRLGWVEALRAMGAEVEVTAAEEHGDPVGEIRARSSELVGVTIGGELIPRLIDEIPVLCVAAAKANGRTVIKDAAELRVKETDRLRAIRAEWAKLGLVVEELPDGLVIEGPQRIRGGRCTSYGDHRIAMALAVAGIVAEEPVVIEDAGCVRVSFPGFEAAMRALGADIRLVGAAGE